MYGTRIDMSFDRFSPTYSWSVIALAASTAEATRKAYDYDWGAFADWGAERGTAPLSATPATVAAFLATQAEQASKASTIARRVVAIRYAYRLVGKEPTTNSEAVKATLRGIRRAIGTARDQK